MLKAILNESETNLPQGNIPRPTLDERFLIKLGNREFVQYPGLLDLAHQKGLSRLEVEILQLPTPENPECIVRATAETETGLICTDIGDANAKNTSSLVSKHLIRMASTRAKARVLRDVTNIGITSSEELAGDLGDINGDIPGNGDARKKPVKVPDKAMAPEKPVNDNAIVPISDAQKRAIWALAKNKGHDERSLQDLAQNTFGCGISALNNKDAAALIQQLQTH